MRRFNAMLKMYDLSNYDSYKVEVGDIKGKKAFHIVVECYNNNVEIVIFKTVLYINRVKCNVFSRTFISAMFNEFNMFYNLTK